MRKTEALLLTFLMAALLAPASYAENRITQAFDTPEAAASYCAQRYSPNDVVRRDNVYTSQTYSQLYSTFYIKATLPGGSPNPDFSPNAPNFAGSYYCLAEAVLSGWKDRNDPNAATIQVNVKELFQQPKTLNSSSTVDDAISVCKGFDNVVWSLDQLSHDISNISHQPIVWFYATNGKSKWTEQASAGSSYANHFACRDQMPQPSQDYAVYEANERANAARAAAQAQAAQVAATAQQITQVAAKPLGMLIDVFHNLSNSPLGALFVVADNGGRKEGWQFKLDQVRVKKNGSNRYDLTLPDGSIFQVNGVISNDGNSIISPDGNSFISHNGSAVVFGSASSLVGNSGGTYIPASLITENGAGIISQDGAGLIAQDGAGFARSIAQLISNSAQLISPTATSLLGPQGAAALAPSLPGMGVGGNNGASAISNGSSLVTDNGAGLASHNEPTGGGAPPVSSGIRPYAASTPAAPSIAAPVPPPPPAAAPVPAAAPAAASPNQGAPNAVPMARLHDFQPGNARAYFMVTDQSEGWHFSENDAKVETATDGSWKVQFRDGSTLTVRRSANGLSTDHGEVVAAGVGAMVPYGANGFTEATSALVARGGNEMQRVVDGLVARLPNQAPAARLAPTPPMQTPPTVQLPPAASFPAPSTPVSPAPQQPASGSRSGSRPQTTSNVSAAPAMTPPAPMPATMSTPAPVAAPAVPHVDPNSGNAHRNRVEGMIEARTLGVLPPPDAGTLRRLGLLPYSPSHRDASLMFFPSVVKARQDARERGAACEEVLLLTGKSYAVKVPSSMRQDVVSVGCAADAAHAGWTPKFF